MLSFASLRALFFVGGLAQHRRPLRPSPDKRFASLRWRGSVRAGSAPQPAAFGRRRSLGASLPAPVPPKRCSVPLHIVIGCRRAPLVMRPCWVARPAATCRSAKAHRVFGCSAAGSPSRKGRTGVSSDAAAAAGGTASAACSKYSLRRFCWPGLAPGATGRGRPHFDLGLVSVVSLSCFDLVLFGL